MKYVDTPQGICRFGLAWDDITPPLDIYWRMWGAAPGDHATGVHRPLRATVVLFQAVDARDNADSTQYLVALDHCMLRELEMQPDPHVAQHQRNPHKQQPQPWVARAGYPAVRGSGCGRRACR